MGQGEEKTHPGEGKNRWRSVALKAHLRLIVINSINIQVMVRYSAPTFSCTGAGQSWMDSGLWFCQAGSVKWKTYARECL